MKKGKKSYSILKSKCPRCHEGKFFEHDFNWNLNKIATVCKSCPNCGLKYMIEPSFFYGAMYVTYGLTVAIGVLSFVFARVLLGVSLFTSFVSVFIILVVLIPVTLRLSRIIWINLFIHYDSNKIDI